MTLIQSWMDSLTLLKPKNLQLFAMVTLKSIIEGYKLYFKYFWWLIGAAIAWNGYYYLYLRDFSWPSCWIFDVQQWVYWFLLLAACFCTRPSVMKKDCTYFRMQFQKNAFYALLILLLPSAWTIMTFFHQSGFPRFVGWSFLICLPTTYVVLYIFYILFLADSKSTLRDCLLSVWNALKMIFYNLPLLVVMYFICIWVPTEMFEVFCNTLGTLGDYITTYHDPSGALTFQYNQSKILLYTAIVLKNIVWPLILPVTVCIFANIYIKKLHDQFELYKN